MSCEFGEQVSAVSTGVLDWVFMSAWIRGVRAEELQTNPLREDEEGSAGIRVHFHKSQMRSDLNQRVLGSGWEIRGDPLPADPPGQPSPARLRLHVGKILLHVRFEAFVFDSRPVWDQVPPRHLHPMSNDDKSE